MPSGFKSTKKRSWRTPSALDLKGLSLRQTCEDAGVSYGGYYARRDRGLTHREALNLPTRHDHAPHADVSRTNGSLMADWAVDSKDVTPRVVALIDLHNADNAASLRGRV